MLPQEPWAQLLMGVEAVFRCVCDTHVHAHIHTHTALSAFFLYPALRGIGCIPMPMPLSAGE